MGNNTIRIIDARMGRGKTTAAINYMEAHKRDKRFIYATPLLKEVERICEACDFDQPDDDNSSKLSEMKGLMRHGKNISATHALFYLMDEEALELVREKKYSIIIDESVSPIGREMVSASDTKLLMSQFFTENEDHRLMWTDPEYNGKFNEIKAMADSGALLKLDGAFVSLMNPELIRAFEEVIMMTYLFEGQYQKAYLDYFGFDYVVCGVKEVDGNTVFSDEPDCPPPVDYSSLVNLIDDDDKINDIGKAHFSLSVGWYSRRNSENNADIRKLRNNLDTFFRRRACASAPQQLWTCPRDQLSKVCGNSGRFSSGFLAMNARATNAYKDRDAVAYLVNRFADPTITKFFRDKDISIDEDQYALGEMLQFIWRSSIRDDKPINLYIPSQRMRKLFKDWLISVSKGGDNA